jgi:hypothetical protein
LNMYAKDDRPLGHNVFPINSLLSSDPQPVTKTAKEIAELYGVSDRTVQSWFKVVNQAHPWLKEADLKTGKSAQTRYTTLCQELISAFRASSQGAEEWTAAVHRSNAEKLPREKTSPERSLEQFSLTPTVEVLDSEECGGRIDSAARSYEAEPILQIHLQNLIITLPTVNTSTLDAQTAQFITQSAQAAEVLGQFITADLRAKLEGVLAQNTQMVAALQNSAIIGAIQGSGIGKPEEDSLPTS